MSLKDDLARFDDEGGAMQATTAFKMEEPLQEFSEDYSGAQTFAYILVALSSSLMGALITWLVMRG